MNYNRAFDEEAWTCDDCDYRSVSPELYDLEQSFNDGDTLCWPCSEERERSLNPKSKVTLNPESVAPGQENTGPAARPDGRVRQRETSLRRDGRRGFHHQDVIHCSQYEPMHMEVHQ